MKCNPRSSVEEEVLEAIRPTGFQLRLLSRYYGLLERTLSGCLDRSGYEYRIVPVGSYAKGTITSYKWELDVFILLRGVSDEWILSNGERLLRECLEGKLPVIVKYAQHPYVTVSLSGVEADIVPAVWVDRPRRKGLGVERTPFHTQYVTGRLTDCLRDDVRLFKSFLKGLGVYGAETGIRGFSGYLAEILIIHYGGFRRLLEEASRWRPPVYIDPEGRGDRSRLERRYRDSPIIVVDPVDPERNAAASVEARSLAILIAASKFYLRRPGKEFFYPFNRKSPILHPGPVVTVDCWGGYESLPPDAVRGLALRASRSLAEELERRGFPVTLYSYSTDEHDWVRVEVGILSKQIPEYARSPGPYAWDEDWRVARFAEKRAERGEPLWIGPDGRLYGARRVPHERAIYVVYDWLEGPGMGILRGGKCIPRIVECPGDAELCYPVPSWMAPL